MKLLRTGLIRLLCLAIGMAPMGSAFARPFHAAAAAPAQNMALFDLSDADCHKVGIPAKTTHGKHMQKGDICPSCKDCSSYCFAKCFQLVGVMTSEAQSVGMVAVRLSQAELLLPAIRSIRPAAPPPRG